MTALELARLQFGVTTVYHFIFVPLSIGLAAFVAVLQTAHHRTGKPVYDRMTRFWGKLMLLSFAVGVVTGIVQEFQFGMNWSEYSRYVGDVFGAPLAMEALAAFFLESTFIGLWIFGRGRLPARVHLATIWLVAIGSMMSAYFILAANSWMQHPVGYEIAESGRAEMTSIWALLTNSTAVYAFFHTILGALATGGMVILGISAYHLLRRHDEDGFRRSAVLALAVTFVATVSTATVGHFQAQLMTEQQPMKMAAAEALYDTQEGAPFSLLAVAPFEATPERLTHNIEIPNVLSFLSTNRFDGRVEGINDLQAEYEDRYGPGDYRPVIGVTYWSFRLMVGSGVLMILFTGLGLLLHRRGKLTVSRRFLRVAPWAMALPFVANATGWIFTEMGRQPWVVQGLLHTADAVSPTVGAGTVAASLIAFALLYGVLAGVAGWIAVREMRKGTEPDAPPPAADAPADLAY
ncbi:MAG: cytochrome ubiquinol oxidase subunit I [Thermoleophilia bacterium]